MHTHTKPNLTALKNLGVATVEVSFSGGNDEGGADGFTFHGADGSKVEVAGINTHAYQGQEYDDATKTWKKTGWKVTDWSGGTHTLRDATADEVAASELRETLEKPIYDEYYSFAGDFYVNGTLTWDVEAGTAEMHGQMDYTSTESF